MANGRMIEEVEDRTGVTRLVMGTDDRQSVLLSWALTALSSRALVWVSVLGLGGLWTLTVINPSTLKIVATSLACITILVPVMWRDVKGA